MKWIIPENSLSTSKIKLTITVSLSLATEILRGDDPPETNETSSMSQVDLEKLRWLRLPFGNFTVCY
jgi:hypothetical protein